MVFVPGRRKRRIERRIERNNNVKKVGAVVSWGDNERQKCEENEYLRHMIIVHTGVFDPRLTIPKEN